MTARHVVLAAALMAMSVGSIFARTATTAPATAAASQAASAMTRGEIRKVDKEAGKLTIRHEVLTNLDMPAMTMVFRVADPKMLDEVQPGEKVQFVAERIDGQLTVMQLAPDN